MARSKTAVSKTPNENEVEKKKADVKSAAGAGKKVATKKAGKKATGKSVTKNTTARKAASKKTASKKVAAKKTAAKKAATKKAAGKKTASKKKATKKAASKSVVARMDVKSEAGITKEDGRYALPASVEVELPAGYQPSENEEYMGPQHLAFFRQMLRDWRNQLVEESRQTIDNLQGEVRDVGDEAERATRETENSLELRTRDRYRKLISKIDKALRRVEEGSYGFCEETDEEIGLKRLEARPIATLSLDAQERREHMEKQMRD